MSRNFDFAVIHVIASRDTSRSYGPEIRSGIKVAIHVHRRSHDVSF